MMKRRFLLLFFFVALASGASPVLPAAIEDAIAPRPFGTFSIVAYDEKSGDLGVAVASKFLAVGGVVPWAQAGVGAVATQAWADPGYGPRGLALLKEGVAPEAAIAQLTADDPERERRQVGMVDARGRAAAFTGKKTFGFAGHRIGRHFVCQGNILAGGKVLAAMAEAFETSTGELADRLLAALQAGERAGGDKRGRQSAALLVVRAGGGFAGLNDRFIDLRVDDHAQPVQELSRLLGLHKKFYPRE